MSKFTKFKNIMCETARRWKETIVSTAEPDVEKAKALLKKAYPRATVFVVDSPLQFYIAQAIIRGRLSKKQAAEWCKTRFNIDPAFIKNISRVGGVRDLIHTSSRWAGNEANSVQAMMMRDFMRTCWDAKSGTEIAPEGRSAWRRTEQDTSTFVTRMCDVLTLYRRFVPAEKTSGPYYYSEVDHKLNFSNSINAINRATMSIYSAISHSAQDLLNDAYNPTAHFHDATQAEIISKVIGCNDGRITWRFELFHCVPAAMRFEDAFLLLGKKPKIALKGNLLHNEKGPAVEWADGNADWAIDGHNLLEYGKEIVLTPEKLTGKMVDAIANEENRRIAIDRIGWGKYLAEIGAKVTDKRENWVDNTVEALIKPPDIEDRRRNETVPLRMLLSCRSTGRKYFLAVPKTAELNDLDEIDAESEKAGKNSFMSAPTKQIKTCEDAQNWFANGAVTKLLPYAKYPMRIVGAS